MQAAEGDGCGLPPSVLPDISPTGGEIDSLKALAHFESCG
ncbi:hypothetical protein DSM25558_1469 [Agrobacterium sp. DSM 25558]|uniref:Uncharacterized protein n=1 Tax=Agrobacterium rosae TaxID=1972867 RepID=A0A1R3TSZ0_9HYPH|nr:hypothetical protein DSM25558_1469 [Agrobacterium sp. DSM 25558]SCX23288.1 hypothetical protein DSM25559_2361 [Agrobacterium rosae]